MITLHFLRPCDMPAALAVHCHRNMSLNETHMPGNHNHYDENLGNGVLRVIKVPIAWALSSAVMCNLTASLLWPFKYNLEHSRHCLHAWCILTIRTRQSRHFMAGESRVTGGRAANQKDSNHVLSK